ncbi:MAG: nucleotidyltransferase domain-containing protein, partial [Candidatus Bathyarchaeia archaeon]
KGMDSEADVYLFGSLAEGRHTYSSDIDILIVTKRKPEVVIAELWKAHVTSPFEIHVIPPERLYLYAKRGRLLRLGSEGRKEN